jgi:hypothetical protein
MLKLIILVLSLLQNKYKFTELFLQSALSNNFCAQTQPPALELHSNCRDLTYIMFTLEKKELE